MSEWKEYQLGEVAPLAKNRILATDVLLCDYISTENMIADKGGVMEASSMPHNGTVTRFVKGDVLVSNIRPYFKKIWFADRDGGCSPDVLCFHCDEKKIQNKYLYYLLSQNDFFEYVMLGSKGCKMPRGDQAHIMAWRVRVPLLEVQETITEILSSLDDKIDLLNRQNTTLESLTETLFVDYFIEKSKEEWKDATIADIVDFNPIRRLPKDTIAPFLEMANLSTTTYAPKGWYDRSFTSGTKFMNGDTLLARITPCLENGKTAYIDFLKEEEIAWGSTEYIVMRPKNGLHPFFAYIIAKYEDFRNFAEGCMSGSSGRQRVDVDNLKGYEIKIPDEGTVSQFNCFAELAVSKMNCNNREIRVLTKLRDTLLPKLMSNEITVLQ